MKLERIPTPALVLDRAAFEKNADAMTALLAGSTLALRPHYKSHKCSAIAKWQIAHGAKGMTCAKLSEARDLADCGIGDILIANQITDPRKIRELADLAGDCRLTVCVDDEANAKALSAAAKAAGTTIHCLVEYEIGMNRCGLTDPEAVVRLARTIAALPGLKFDGVQAYAGHLSHTVSETERAEKTAENSAKLRKLLEMLANSWVPAKTLSGGSTGTAAIKAAEGLYTELQAGSYLFMDSTYRDLGLVFENSLFLLTTVVSARDGLVVVDAGVKTCGVDQGMPAVAGHTVREIVASEEHFQLHGLSGEVRPGDRLLLVPGHCCSTVNLHEKIYLVEDDEVLDRLLITGRGIGR